jgi:hypothetical protein
MHFTHPILNRFERGSNVRILPNTYRWNRTRFPNEYQSNFTSTGKRRSKHLIRPYSTCFEEPSRCVRKILSFSTLILQTILIRTNDVKTALIRCISHIQYWTVLNEVQTFEYSRIHIVETKQGLSSEYQSNFTSTGKRKSNQQIRPNSMSFW